MNNVILFLLSLVMLSPSRPTGKWTMHLMILNADTIFYALDSTYTINHNLEINKEWIHAAIDSVTVRENALIKFEQTKSLMIEFIDDSLIVTTKTRSGGKIFPAEVDSGSYAMQNDTVVFTLHTRRNYQFALVFNDREDILHFDDGIPGHMVHMTYKKKE